MSIKHQKGLTLLEAIVSLGILSAVVAGTATLLSQYSSATQNNVAAQHMKTIADATQAYIRDNYSAVMATATATTPTLIRVSTLQGSGHLAAGVSETNNFGQRVCALVLEPSAGQLNALVVSEGGTTIDDISVAGIAGALGAGGGAVYSSDTTTIRGAMGGWSTAIGNFASANNLGQLCNGSAGTIPIAAGHPMVALWFNGGDATAGTLYRSSVPGRPELNTMNTPIFMSASTVQTVGGACTSTGAIGRDAAGAVVSCQGGTWKGGAGGLNWKGSVANVASLPASGNASGDAYRITGLSNHVFVWDAQNSVWQGLVVNSAGTLTLPGIIVAQGSNSNYGALTIQGAKNGYSGINFKDAGGNNVGTLMMSSSYSGFFNAADGAWRWYVDNTGNSIQAGTAQAGYLHPSTVVTEGTACAPNGLVAKNNVGLLLSCQSGVWKKASGDSGKILSPTIPTTFFPAWTACASGTASTRRFYITAAGQLYATSGCNYSLLFNICNLASGSCTGPDPLSTCYTWGMTAKYSLTPAGLLIINSNSYVDGWGASVSCGTVFPPWES